MGKAPQHGRKAVTRVPLEGWLLVVCSSLVAASEYHSMQPTSLNHALLATLGMTKHYTTYMGGRWEGRGRKMMVKSYMLVFSSLAKGRNEQRTKFFISLSEEHDHHSPYVLLSVVNR